MKLNAFSVPVYKTSIQFNCDKLNDYAYLMKSKYQGRQMSNTGWQFVMKEKLDIVEDIEKHVNVLANDIGFLPTQKVNQMWININGNKDFNVPHVHLNSHFSGVMYSKIPKNSGKLVFKNGFEGMYYLWDNLKRKKTTEHNSYAYEIMPKENELYIFPSWLEHSVEPNLSNEDRISISFDTIGE